MSIPDRTLCPGCGAITPDAPVWSCPVCQYESGGEEPLPTLCDLMDGAHDGWTYDDVALGPVLRAAVWACDEVPSA